MTRCNMMVGNGRCANAAEPDAEMCADCEQRLEQELSRRWRQEQERGLKKPS